MRELGRVDRALSILSYIKCVGAEWPLHVSSSVHVYTKRRSDIGLRAVDPLAIIGAWRLAVIEVV